MTGAGTMDDLMDDPAPALARAVHGQFTLQRVVGRGGM